MTTYSFTDFQVDVTDIDFSEFATAADAPHHSADAEEAFYSAEADLVDMFD